MASPAEEPAEGETQREEDPRIVECIACSGNGMILDDYQCTLCSGSGMQGDEADVVQAADVRSPKKPSSRDVELIPGLLGSGKWRRLKGGITIDSGCSIDTMPAGHAPNITLGPIPEHRRGRVISAANGTRIKESGV